MTMAGSKPAAKGAGFLFADVDPDALTTPERLTDEQLMLRDSIKKFVETELQPRMPELEKLNPALLREMLQKAGELGLCMIDIPPDYDGLGLDFLSSIQPSELLAWAGGFVTTHSVQTVIGALPILYFGSEAQKKKYLPKIGTAEWVSAYALTEAGSGSDALGAKTTAVLSPDGGEWILNGSKQFITNGSIADVFVVFAKVDGKKENFSAFIVEKAAPGFGVGAEEHKLGIKCSSTTTLSFQDCRIPKDALIGQIGWGGKIALNVLNVGRLKLGLMAVGSAKEALQLSAQYALERRQFGQQIANFGLIREKIAEMASRIYAAESTALRTTGLVNEARHAAEGSGGGTGGGGGEAIMGALREFNVECAIEKVHGSEAQAYCVDEGVQIHGGYGFIEEYTIARLYRDARISRLYEGTNEINRLQVAGDILKRAGKGELSLDGAAGGADGGADGGGRDFGSLNDVAGQVRNAKKAILGLLGLVGRTMGASAGRTGADQELLRLLADMIIAAYGIETSMGRAVQARGAGSEHAGLFEAMTRVYAARAGGILFQCAREAGAALVAAGATAAEAAEIEKLATGPSVNAIALRREVAAAILERRGVWFN